MTINKNYSNTSEIGMKECYNESCPTNRAWNKLAKYGVGYIKNLNYDYKKMRKTSEEEYLVKWADNPTWGWGLNWLYMHFDRKDRYEMSIPEQIALDSLIEELEPIYLEWLQIHEFRKEFGHIGYLREEYSNDPNLWALYSNQLRLAEVPELDSRFQNLKLCCPYCGNTDVGYAITKGTKKPYQDESTSEFPCLGRGTNIDYFSDEEYMRKNDEVQCISRDRDNNWKSNKVDISPVSECNWWEQVRKPVIDNYWNDIKEAKKYKYEIMKEYYEEKKGKFIKVSSLNSIFQEYESNKFQMNSTHWGSEPSRELKTYLKEI